MIEAIYCKNNLLNISQTMNPRWRRRLTDAVEAVIKRGPHSDVTDWAWHAVQTWRQEQIVTMHTASLTHNVHLFMLRRPTALKKRIAVCATSTAPLWKLTCRMGSHGVTCHPAEVTFPPLPQQIKAETQFSNPGGIQGWVLLVGLVT